MTVVPDGARRILRALTTLAMNAVPAFGYPAARDRDLATAMTELLALTATQDPFRDIHSSRCLADRIRLTYAELGDWTAVMDWVEQGYQRRPGRLRRVLTDMPFDRRGLAGNPRYVRLLRTAGLEELL